MTCCLSHRHLSPETLNNGYYQPTRDQKEKNPSTFNRILNIAETHFFGQRIRQVNVAVPLPNAAKRAACKLLFTNRQRNNTCASLPLIKFNLQATRQTFSLCIASKMSESHRKILLTENVRNKFAACVLLPYSSLL